MAIPRTPEQVTLKGHQGSDCTFPPTAKAAEAKAAALQTQDQANAFILVLTCRTPLCLHPVTLGQGQCRGHYP